MNHTQDNDKGLPDHRLRGIGSPVLAAAKPVIVQRSELKCSSTSSESRNLNHFVKVIKFEVSKVGSNDTIDLWQC